MKRIALFLASGALLCIPTTAQVTATATVRTPCSAAAPADSLVAKQSTPKTFLPESDVVVVEVEHDGTAGAWVEETALSGFGGDSYFRWDGPNQFGSPGNGVLTFRFLNLTQQDYFIRVHVRHDDPDSSEENDCWARLDGQTWEKLFHNTGPSGVGVWTYNGRYESTGEFPRYNNLSVGTHTFEISGRSHNFKIDRVHVVPVSIWFANLGDPESDTLRDRPVTGTTFSVEIGDPTSSLGFNPSTTFAAYYGGAPDPNYPCGTVYPFGEVMLRLTAPKITKAGPDRPWGGPNNPAVFGVAIPNDPSLVGLPFASQGILYDLSSGGFQMTDALDLVVGDL